MHWVDRGPEPNGLSAIRHSYTRRWIDYYKDGIGSRPNDSRWIGFRADLTTTFSDLCAYCEAVCKGEVDHFRPKSRFPELVYEWSNWLIACHDCNHAKGDKWPASGYVDPCAESTSKRPEYYFDFDTLTGELVPKVGLTSTRRQKAQRMINDLRLNEHHHLRKRLRWLYLVGKALTADPDAQSPELRRTCANLVSPATSFSGVTRAWLTERGFLQDA